MPDDGKRMMTGGEAVVEMLRRFDVEQMFGLPGEQTPIYDAIYRRNDIRHTLVRHEQAAAHMADGYARVTGKVGVCDATFGPGATNLISGISEAFLSSIPVIAIVSDIRTDWRGRDSFQEIDQCKVFEPITKQVFSVDLIERIPELMARAFQIATSGRPGPVLLSFPVQVLRGEHAFDEDEFDVDTRYARFPPHRLMPPEEDIATALTAMLAAERPVILAGGGVIASGAMAEVQALADKLDIPVATTYMGKGTMPEGDPMCLGPFGLLGRQVTNDYVLGADFALALGTRLTNVGTAAWRIPDPKIHMVHVDIEPTQLARTYKAKQVLAGDIRSILRSMLNMIETGGLSKKTTATRDTVSNLTANWRRARSVGSDIAQDNNTAPVHPLQVIRALKNTMKSDDIFVCDSGFNQIWGGQYFEGGSAGRVYMGPRGFAVMGFALPAAIGAATARPDRGVVALAGDGGFAMVIHELETALRMGVPITVCIMNNANLQYIKENQKVLFDERYISTDFTDTDYAAVARAFGCFGIRVENSGDLEGALAEAMASNLPAVVDVRVIDDVVPDRIHMAKLK